MRKLYIAIAVIMLLALLVPTSLVSAVDTTVTVGGGGDPPVVKCKWEQQFIPALEDGDPLHAIPGFQILPPGAACAEKEIEYFAVVTDEQDSGSVDQVFADVYHPAGSPEPYGPSSVGGILGLPYFKYEVSFWDLQAAAMTKAEAAACVQAAYDAGLVTFGGYTLAEVLYELDKGTAHLWWGCEQIWYEQPAGAYDVYVFAVDQNSNFSAPLWNQFTYVPVAGIEIDFNQIDFGSPSLGTEKMVPGDTYWDDPAGTNKATVRNVGNTFVSVEVEFDDMGFGQQSDGTWNVQYDARMGSNDAYYVTGILPGVPTTLVNALKLSHKDELDLSILVIKGFGTHSGTITLTPVVRDFTYTPVVGVPSPCP
jgi:hypothetical protein